MTSQRPAPEPPGHDPTLPYQDEIVAGSAIDLDRWDWWWHTDRQIVHYYAKGPCPACQADTQDHYADVDGLFGAPIEGQGPDTAPASPTDSVEMPLRCHCGSDHGHPGADGCGRRWSLLGPRATVSE